MLFVHFTNVPKDAFSNYEHLPYEEVLLLSIQVPQEAQQANECFASEFRIFDDADQLVYKGMFQFYDTNNPIDIETVIMQSKPFETDHQETLQALQAVHPMNEGAFDLAMLEKDYKCAVSIPDVEMTTARKEANTRAYIALKDVTKAQESVKMVQEEQLDEEIKALEDQKQQLSDERAREAQ